MSFYLDTPTDELRLGDVVTGFPVTTPEAHQKEAKLRREKWTIKAHHPLYLVVLTPCCSIEDKCVLLAPLAQIRASFLKNAWWSDDLTRLNRTMPFENSITPEYLNNLSLEERAERSSVGNQYAVRECFLYAPHDVLPGYELPTKPPSGVIKHYMVDFKSIFRTECEFITRPAKAPAGTKFLELTIKARTELREKLAHFFGRAAQEDL